MDHPDGVANGSRFSMLVFKLLTAWSAGSIMGMWPSSILFLRVGAFLHVGSFPWPPLHPEADG